MVSWDTDLVVLGGYNGSSYSATFFLIECQNGVFTWKTLEEPKMKKARHNFVAFQVPYSFVNSHVNKPEKEKLKQQCCILL